MRARTVSLLAIAMAVGCGGISEVDHSVATVLPIRGGTELGGSAAAIVARAEVGDTLSTSEEGLARLSLDLGPQLLLGEDTELELMADGVVLERGHLFGEAQPGEHLEVRVGEASLRAVDASMSIERGDEGTRIYVIRGEIGWTLGEERGVGSSGEELILADTTFEVQNATLWHDWTGGLARPGPAGASGPAGVGMLEARVPDEVGQARWPLVVRRLDVRVRIEEDLAITEVDQLFFNPASEMVEGLYRIRVPEGAVLQRFAVDRDDRLVDGYVREKAQAQQAYERQVYRGSTLDPALLEWDAPGSYRARIYPIHPGETRRIVIRYAEWLRPPAGAEARLYRYPMGGGGRAPHIQEFALNVDIAESGAQAVRAGMGAIIEDGAVRIRRSDFAPRSDFWLELTGPDGRGQRAWTAPHEPPERAPDSPPMPNEADERDYYYLPLELPETLGNAEPAASVDLVILADVSAATDRSQLELGRSVVEALTAHLGPEDRVAIVSSDLTIRSVIGDEAPVLAEATPERIDALLDGLARVPAGGGTDLGEAIAAAAELLDPERAGAVVYVGDGAPTVGEMRAEGLIERIQRLTDPLRLYAVAIGSDSNLALLETLTRGGGLSMRVEERAQAADAALRVLAHAGRPIAHDVEVDLGEGIENRFPRGPMDAVLGEVFSVVGRVGDGAPNEVVVTGTINGQPFEETIAVSTAATPESRDLRLRWASERLRQLILEDGGREAVAELGTRYGLITPFTSYYVPSRQELNQMGHSALQLIDRPLLPIGTPRRHERNAAAEATLAVLFAPLALSGCSMSDEAPMSGGSSEPAAVTSSESWEDDTEEAWEPEEPAMEEEGAMGAEASERTSNRFAIEGPSDNVAPQMARERAQAEQRMARAYADDMDMAEAEPAPRPSAAAPSMPSNDPLAGLDDLGGDMPMGQPTPDTTASPGGTASGYGLRGTGRGGGGSGEGTIGLGRFGTIGGGEAQGGDGRLADEMNGPARRSAGADTSTADRLAHSGLLGAIAPNEPVEATGEEAAIQIVTRIVHTTDQSQHQARRCSDASDLSLADRSALWSERLGNEGNPSGWVRRYREAIRQCEAPTWRDRRTFLGQILARAGSIQSKLAVYQMMETSSARAYLRARILRSVRGSDDLREVRRVFGLGAEVDWALVDQILERLPNDTARLRQLRRLVMQYPNSFELKLRLLATLERTNHGAEADRLATLMRTDPRADAGIRTAIGEMYLRMGREDDARRVFSEIVEFAPLDELARRRLGDLYRAHGWYEDAYRQYRTLHDEILRNDDGVKLLMAQAAAGAGRVDEALRLERTVMQSAQTGASSGVARAALLWSSVRFARMRKEARTAEDDAQLELLARRMRRSGVLREAGQLRVTLVWSHPDAEVGLWAGFPNMSMSRPTDIMPEYGLEAFHLDEQEGDTTYRFEVRRPVTEDELTEVDAQLVVVWNEGEDDEKVEIVDLHFDRERQTYAWTLSGRTLTGADQ